MSSTTQRVSNAFPKRIGFGGSKLRYNRPKGGLNQVQKKQVAATVKRRLLKTRELKIHDNAISTAVGTTLHATDLNLITQGDNYYNRQGASNMMKKLRVRLNVTPHVSSTFCQLRVLVIIWTDISSNVPVNADMWEAPAN